jgi:hypothetical protein
LRFIARFKARQAAAGTHSTALCSLLLASTLIRSVSKLQHNCLDSFQQTDPKEAATTTAKSALLDYEQAIDHRRAGAPVLDDR